MTPRKRVNIGEKQEKTLKRKRNASELKWSLPFLAVFLPIVILSFYSFKIASGSVRTLVEEENLSAAGGLAQLLTQDVQQNIKLASAVASIPGTIRAVRENDELVLRTRLRALMVSDPNVHRAFVTNADGILWSEFPIAAGAFGTDFSEWSWFTSVRDTQRGYVSGLYIRSQFPDEPVVAIAVPIRDKGEFLGVLVFEYRVKHISKWLKNIRLGISGNMFLLDQYGALVAHPYIPVGKILYKGYHSVEQVKMAQETETLFTADYIDPETKKEMIATFMPIAMGKHRWLIIAQQAHSEAFSLLDEVKYNLSVVGGVLTLFTLIMVLALGRMSAKVVSLNRDLEEKNQSLKDFTSIVSHQLKAPITAMRWNLESILAGDYGAINTKLRELIEMLHDVNISNFKLIMDILNVSRLDRGVVAVTLVPMTLRAVTDRAIRDYTGAATKAGLYLNIEGEGDTMVMVDLEKTAESITNSISNAIKYTKKGGITIKMSKEGDKASIAVSDTGTGIKPEMMKMLFSREGIRKSNTGADSSSGLGLYIAKNFMQMQGGDIVVESKIGKGTTFIYTVKVATQKEINSQKKKE